MEGIGTCLKKNKNNNYSTKNNNNNNIVNINNIKTDNNAPQCPTPNAVQLSFMPGGPGSPGLLATHCVSLPAHLFLFLSLPLFLLLDLLLLLLLLLPHRIMNLPLL